MTAPSPNGRPGTPRAPGRAGQVLVVVGIVALAFNLRPAAVSVGPVLDEIRASLTMSGAEAGILTSLPVLAFAVFGALAAGLGRAVGVHRLTLIALIAVAVGLFARTRVESASAFLAFSLLGLAGMATANVLLRSLVKLHFPGRVGLMTAVYSTALAIGLTSASVLTVPLGAGLGGWRSGLVVWSLTAAVAALPWLFLLRQDAAVRRDPTSAPSIALRQVGRTRLGWLMALFFGLQSLHAYSIFGWFAAVYRDAGFSAATAGLLLGVITGVSIPLSFLVPMLAGRMTNVTPLVWALVSCYPVGYVGLAFAPVGGAWLWAVLIGTAASTFPLVLTLIGLRARTPAGTAALSGFTQSVGYLLAAVGPFGVGVLHDASGGWTLPLLVLAVLSVPILLVGLAVSRPRFIEDELDKLEGSA